MRGASLVLVLASLLSPPSARADASPGHCAPVEPIAPLEGDPTRYRVVTARGISFPRTPPPARATGTPLFVIEARAFTFDADGSDATPVDTLVVEVGSTVRWQWVAGIHTLTNGTDGGDPQAGQFFGPVLLAWLAAQFGGWGASLWAMLAFAAGCAACGYAVLRIEARRGE